MIVWPLPEDRYERAGLMMHESWHRVQDRIGFPWFNVSSDHLDSPEGRIWLQMEWRALCRALTRRGAERRKAIRDALVFREYRQGLFSEADALERGLEMNEGLAEYTGVKLSGVPECRLPEYVAQQFGKASEWATFIRSFPYLSGPAYGVLLDESGVDWRAHLTPAHDLGILLKEALAIEVPADIRAEAQRRSGEYDGVALRQSEIERERRRQERIAECRARFVDGPVLIVPMDMESFSISYKPTDLQPLGEYGTVYPNIRVAGSWGILTVSGAALMTPDWAKIVVPAPSDPDIRPLRGDGWTLELSDDWKLEPAARKGDFVLKKPETSKR